MKNFEGFLNINKQKGMTSHDVVRKVRKILRTRKVGHTGTLDPDAEGVMLICVGRATRVSLFTNELKKEYKAIMALGSRTNTQDAGGDVIETAPIPNLTNQDIEKALKSFSGETKQIPPMFSALKKNGTPLYVLARKGKTTERKPRTINIYKEKLLSVSLPFVTFGVTCSSGTYIRTICEDLGKKLGTVAHLHKLTRTQIGKFSMEKSMLLEELESKVLDNSPTCNFVIPMEEAISHYEKIMVQNADIRQALNGVAIPVSSSNTDKHPKKQTNMLRLFTEDNRFFGIGEIDSLQKRILVKKILVDTDKFIT